VKTGLPTQILKMPYIGVKIAHNIFNKNPKIFFWEGKIPRVGNPDVNK
jgi:hypothetical protein